jgi:hypothetical protein
VIIACPECTQPFQVEDGDIAPLVQVECPHCVFRMILDFEAANDASLVEAGMKMAQGFASEADYRSAVGGGMVSRVETPAPTPRLHAVPTPEPEVVRQPEPQPELEPEPEVTAPARTPRTQPASEKPPVRQPEPRVEPTPEPEPEVGEVTKPPVRIRRATFEPAPEPEAEPAPPEPPISAKPPVRESRARPTLIAHTAPPPALRPPDQSGSGVPPRADEAAAVEPEVEMEVDVDEPQPSPDARHSPPHTPPVVAPIARPEFEEPSHPAADSQSRPIANQEAEPGPTKPEGKKPSVVATVFKVLLLLLLLAVAGVMVWSLIETGNPNPLPMLQEKFGITIPGL